MADYQTEHEDEGGGEAPTQEEPALQPTPLSGSGLSIRYRKDFLQGILQHLLFEDDGNPTEISSHQPQYFLMVTSAFENYPKKVKKKKDGDIKDGVTIVMNHMDHMFDENFPFYIAVAFDIHLKQIDINAVDEFISKCIKKLEEMDTQKLATTLTAFINRANSQDQRSMEHLDKFTEACKFFIRYSSAMKFVLHSRPMYHRIMWTTIVVVCSWKKSDHSEVDSIWDKNVVAHSASCVKVARRVEDLEDGLRLMKLMHLSPAQMIPPGGLVHCLLPQKGYWVVLSFAKLKDFVCRIGVSITSETYLQTVITFLRAKYDEILKTGVDHPAFSSLTTSHEPHLLEGVFNECITFLDALIGTWERNYWGTENLRIESWKWLVSLLKHLKVNDRKHHSLLELLITSQQESTRTHRDEIKEYVREATLKANLSVQDFSQLFEKFMMWPLPFLRKYLGKYKISKYVSIADPEWKTFFKEFCSRHINPEEHRVLLEFLVRVSVKCYEDGRPFTFIYDLLRLEVPNLFQENGSNSKIGADFKKILADYIHHHNLELEILEKMEQILQLIVRDDPFQVLCLDPIYQEFRSMCESYEPSKSKSHCIVLKAASSTICESSSKPVAQRFAWSLVQAQRDRIPVCAEHFDWMHSFKSELNVLGFRHPQDKTAKSSDTAKVSSQEWSCHHRWVMRIQDVLQQWKAKMLREEVNFNDIICYASSFDSIEKVHQQFGDQSLVSMEAVLELKFSFERQYEKLNKNLLGALICTKELLKRITEGMATFTDTTAHSSLELKCIDIDNEFNTLSVYATPGESCKGLEGIRNLLKLLKVMRFIAVIKETCRQYHLDECTRDPDFATLIHIMELKTNKAELTLQKATDAMTDIRRILLLKNDDDIEKLQLFSVINESGEFYNFIREKKFVGDEGQIRFRQQYQLITSQLQHEEYDQIVLNDMYTAFEMISPFMDTLQKFHRLMQKVSSVSKTANFTPLKTVNSNISLITLWFSRAEGDTVTNASIQLESILTSGLYRLIVSRKTNAAKGDVTVNLEYNYQMTFASNAVPDSSLQVQKHQETSICHSLPSHAMPRSIHIKWNSEQISDFVRRLGFLDIAGRVGDRRKHFQSLNKMAEKLISLLLKLSELGNPEYICDRELTLKCSELEEWKAKVSEMEREVKRWGKEVHSLCRQHKWLMFLTVPKVIILSDQITSNEHDAQRIVKEISFLFLNRRDVRSKLQDSVQELLGDCTSLATSETSLKIVGKFLDDLFGNEKIKEYAFPKRFCKSMSSEYHHRSPFTLHAALGFSPAQVIKLILTICHGFPEFYQVFNCHTMATVQNLQLFLDRAVHHQSTYILIGVNKLPYHLQEILLKLDTELKEHGVSAVHFIETSPSILRQVPWIELHEYKEAESLLISDDEAYQWCQDWIVNKNFSKFELVYGNAGDGKTHYIRKQLMEECKSHTTIVINEAFTFVNAICKLQSLPHDQQQCGVFFNFTMIPPGEDVDRSEQEQYVKLTESVEWFFFNLFILGYIEDQDAGISFQFPGGLGFPDSTLPSCTAGEVGNEPSMRSHLGWYIYVEVPNSDVRKTCEQTLKEFKQSFPTLSLLGTTYMVPKSSPVDITEDIQLICKYMKAYDDGTIDTIFLDERDLLLRAILYSSQSVSTEGEEISHPEQKGKKEEEEPPRVGDVDSHLQQQVKKQRKHSQRKLVLQPPNGKRQHFTCDAIQFSTASQLSEEECYFYLHKYMADHVKEGNKTLQMLFIRYMTQRCKFLDNLPAYMFNPGYHKEVTSQGKTKECNTQQLGSTLFSTMLNEANELCSPGAIQNWSDSTHNQLIYDEKDGGYSVGFISLNPQRLEQAFKEKLSTIGVEVPTTREMYSKKEFLHQCLARSLSMTDRMTKGGYLSSVDEHEYVLTLDYTLKMLSIHERYKCGFPVVIQGETGVGKTALVEMYTILMNNAVYDYWKREQGRMKEKLEGIGVNHDDLRALNSLVQPIASKWKEIGRQLPPYKHLVAVDKDPNVNLCNTLRNWLQRTKPGSSHSLQQLCVALRHETVNEVELSCRLKREFLATKGIIHQPLPNSICDIESLSEDDQLLMLRLQHGEKGIMLALEQCTESIKKTSLSLLLVSGERKLQDVLPTNENNSCVDKLNLLHFLLTAKAKTPFYKLNVHAAMSASEVQTSLQTWIDQAEALASKDYSSDDRHFLPEIKVTVFLDEINTSSCVGVFKELMTDRTIDGKPIPENLFIVAACNPHRGNSLAAHVSTDIDETWLRSSYYVRNLHQTIQSLRWDYGALTEWQERDYVKAKLLIVQKKISSVGSVNPLEQKNIPEYNLKLSNLRDMIVKSQSIMREYAYKQLIASNINRRSAHLCSTCCVSQRDIQRVFTFYFWFMKLYQKYQPPGDSCDNEHRAMLMSLGLVYYMRLNSSYRDKYESMLNNSFEALPDCSSFSQVYSEQLDWFIDEVELEDGIARTQALKENIFAIIACVLTTTPLIIVGPPGSSKTLSFSIVISNLKGKDSKNKMFRCTELFAALDPHIYQCSRRTTSREIEDVFKQATKRQGSFIGRFPVKCVVFMDEAGLPPESHESLKVLHYLLDKQEVSFVAITNHILDAAKTNRAISVFRPKASKEDLETLAQGCLYPKPVNAPVEAQENLKTAMKFSNAYHTLLRDSPNLSAFFGLRDFIHFINYLRRKCAQVHAQDVMMALERNFNGTAKEDFDKICRVFLAQVDSHPAKVKQRNILEILTASINDHPSDSSCMREARYMLIIDPSEDNSAIHLLFTFGVLDWKNTRVYVCSSFPRDSDFQNINTIAGVKCSAVQGHTILMSQTDSIHESFYDLFNQRFRRIDNPEGATFFANIAIGAHTKPCCVNPKFQCVIVIKESEVQRTPAPFLNRFEKYSITHGGLLKRLLQKLPPCISSIIQLAVEKAKEFVCRNGGFASFYGIQEETVDSLVLSLLPLPDHHMEQGYESEHLIGTLEVKLLKSLFCRAENEIGLQIPTTDEKELNLDATSIIRLLQKHDENFANCYREINESNLEVLVTEAVKTLVSAPAFSPESTQNYHISKGAHAVISIFFQWLTRHLCKCLMQLMTSEALTVYHSNIPLPYILSYLHQQHHFSLRDLIKKHFRMLKHSSKKCVSNPRMIICFTRSSTFIHQLPSTCHSGSQSGEINPDISTFQKGEEQMEEAGSMQKPQIEARVGVQLKESFSLCKPGVHNINQEEMVVAGYENPANQECSPSVGTMEQGKDERADEDIGCERQGDDVYEVKPDSKIWPLSKLMICKLFDTISLEMMCQTLNDFLSSDALEVLLVVVDMQHYSRSLVNHLRIMIEEADNSLSRHSTGKLFIILLHFQPVMFFDTCYPAFFLRGWGHYYLDSIAPSGTTGVLDIKEWFEHCYISDTDHPPSSLKSALTNHLHRSIPIVASRVLITSISGDVTELGKCKTLRKLFFEKGIGEILTSLFLAYWKPAVMRRYLEKAAEFLLSNESTLSLTDSIQTRYTSLFTDFLVYMVMKMDENCCLQTILEANCSEAIWQLFRGILKHYPVPNLPEIKQATNKILEETPMTHQGKDTRYPFFDLISTEISRIINEASQCSQLKFQDSESKSIRHPTQTSAQKFDAVCNIFESRLQKLLQEKHYLAEALSIMEEHQELIKLYCLDFYSKVLQFQPMHDEVRNLYLHLMVPKFFQADQSVTVRLISLHANSILQPVNPRNVSHILHTLDRITQVAATQPNSELYKILGSTSSTDMSALTDIVGTLFIALSCAVQKGDMRLQEWCTAYYDMVHTHPLTEHLFNIYNLPSGLCGAKLSIMQIMFLVMRPLPGCSQDCQDCQYCQDFLQKGKTLFLEMKAEYFTEDLELNDVCPQLPQLVPRALAILKESSGQDKKIRQLIEGLLAHFFPMTHSTTMFNTANIEWLLEHANRQCFAKPDSSSSLIDELEFFSSFLLVYVSRVLGHGDAAPLKHHNKEVRDLVGAVLTSSEVTSSTYIPLFYEHCKLIQLSMQNKGLHQPLAHIYFLIVHDNLIKGGHTISGLVAIARRITDNMKKELSAGERVLQAIEKEAVVQTILKKLADVLNPQESQMIGEITDYEDELNSVLDNQESTSGHGLTLALHMLRKQKSFRMLKVLLTDMYSGICAGIQCLKPCHESALKDDKTSRMECRPKVLLELGPIFGVQPHEIVSSYQHFCDAMVAFYDHPDEVDCFIETLNERVVPGDISGPEKLRLLRMMLWLCTYYEYYIHQKPFKALSAIVTKQLIHLFEDVPQAALLTQCFLDPDSLVKKPECSENISADPESVQQRRDDLFTLFTVQQQNNDTTHLCDVVISMVAVVLATPPFSSYLWYHLFAVDKLQDAYTTAFKNNPMFWPLEVHCDGEGTSDDEKYRCATYLKWMAMGSLNIDSVSLLHLLNFGAFCIGLLTQPEAEQHMRGRILPHNLPLRNFCTSKLRDTWRHMQSNLCMAEEEVLFLILKCLYCFLQKSSEQHSAMLNHLEDLQEYEKWWQSALLKSRRELKQQFQEWSKMSQDPQLASVRLLDAHYPHIPTLLEFVLSVSSQCTNQRLQLLLTFVSSIEKLNLCRQMLPQLIDFYLWLHKNLAYQVTMKRAGEITIAEVINIVSKYHSDDTGIHLRSTYGSLKVCHKTYVSLDKLHQQALSDDTTLLQLLSYSSKDVPQMGLLWIAIKDLIDTHNKLLKCMTESRDPSYCHLYRDKFPEIHPNEYNSFTSILQEEWEQQLIPLIQSRWCPPQLASIGDVPVFDLHAIQDDIAEVYLAGKPLIHLPDTMPVLFCFGETRNLNSSHPIEGFIADHGFISEKLQEEFKEHVDDELQKQLHFHFHSADYHTLVEVVTGLNIVAWYLLKELDECNQGRHQELLAETVDKFLCFLYQGSKNIFAEIGFSRVSKQQFHCLKEINLVEVCGTMEVFLEWIKDGMYDFCDLPILVKKQMSQSDIEAITICAGQLPTLLCDAKQLTEAFRRSEASITKEDSQMPLKIYLKQLQCNGEVNKLTESLPETLCVHHYVAFRLVLRRLVKQAEEKCADNEKTEQPSSKITEGSRWEEFGSDLWSSGLPHLNSILEPDTSFTYDPSKGEYCFQTYPWWVYASEEGQSELAMAIESPRSSYVTRSLENANADDKSENSNEGSLIPTPVESQQHEVPTDNVTNILCAHQLHDYVELFKEEEICGDDFAKPIPELDKLLRDAGVSSALDRLRITTAFKIGPTTDQHSVQNVVKFLDRMNMHQYSQKFEEKGIGTEILLHIDDQELLLELGVSDPLDCLKIVVLFKRHVKGASAFAQKYPLEATMKILDEIDMSHHIASFQYHEIDAECISEATTQALKKLGVKDRKQREKIKEYFVALKNSAHDPN